MVASWGCCAQAWPRRGTWQPLSLQRFQLRGRPKEAGLGLRQTRVMPPLAASPTPQGPSSSPGQGPAPAVNREGCMGHAAGPALWAQMVLIPCCLFRRKTNQPRANRPCFILCLFSLAYALAWSQCPAGCMLQGARCTGLAFSGAQGCCPGRVCSAPEGSSPVPTPRLVPVPFGHSSSSRAWHLLAVLERGAGPSQKVRPKWALRSACVAVPRSWPCRARVCCFLARGHSGAAQCSGRVGGRPRPVGPQEFTEEEMVLGCRLGVGSARLSYLLPSMATRPYFTDEKTQVGRGPEVSEWEAAGEVGCESTALGQAAQTAWYM